MRAFVCALLFTAAFAPCVARANSQVQQLSPKVKSLFLQEMNALDAGTKELLSAYVRGDLKSISQIAKKMEQSYILKQSLTKQQKQELASILPEGFRHQDKGFHKRAAMLSHVADEGHSELVGFYISKITESCVSCHSQNAKLRFPHFAELKAHSSHHH